jgi:HSP20 family molecular chaperone IbpA
MMEVINLFDGLATARTYSVKNTENGVELALALPGVAKEDVTVRCTVDELKIKISEKNESPLLLRKSFVFKHKVLDPKPKARIKDGVLFVELTSGSAHEQEVHLD